jgi:hypothetical protein
MIGYNGMSTNSEKGVKRRIKITINLYGKGNEVVF